MEQWLIEAGRISVDKNRGAMIVNATTNSHAHEAVGRNSYGYVRASLHTPWGRWCVFAHRAIAVAVYGPPPSPKHEVNHKNGVKTDNRPENLEWVTKAENVAHAVGAGLRAALRGDAHPTRKLSESDIRVIRRKCRDGALQRVVAAEYGVTQPAISSVVRRKRWGYVS